MDAEVHWRAIPALAEPAMLWRWSPGAAFGIALYLAMKRWGNPLILPVSVALFVSAYHLVLGALGISGDEARETGLLLKSTLEGALWPALQPVDFLNVGFRRNGHADSDPADADADRAHCRDHEYRGPGNGGERGPGLEPRVPGKRVGKRSGGAWAAEPSQAWSCLPRYAASCSALPPG